MSDGTRTRGHLDHNQVLYQLSYTHHARLGPAEAPRKCTRCQAVSCSGPSPVIDPPYSAARSFASADVRPGEGVNTAAR